MGVSRLRSASRRLSGTSAGTASRKVTGAETSLPESQLVGVLASGSECVSIPGVTPPPAALAAGIAVLIAAAGWKARALTVAGAGTAALLGATILHSAGWEGGVVLLAFFAAGSAVSRVLPQAASLLDVKGDQRDAWQVLANGGASALGAVWARGEGTLPLWIVTASLAAAAADTWATAWGAGSATPPRDVLTGRALPRGASGGVTIRGTTGGAVGGCLVAAIGAAVGGGVSLLVAATVIAAAGMFLDSALGAAAQGRFRCPQCNTPSERRVHRCGARTVREGGWFWLGNDGVNALATAAAAVAGAAAWRWWG